MLSDVPKVTQNSWGAYFLPLSVRIQKLGPNSYTEVLQFMKHLSTSYRKDLDTTEETNTHTASC